jgi:serine/threonine protein kinase
MTAACPSCGTLSVPDARFCGECGTPIAAPERAAELDGHTHAMKAVNAPADVIPTLDAPPPGEAEPIRLDALIGTTLNSRYFIVKKIGEGGFGAVFHAKEMPDGRDLALKILHPHNVSDSTVVARFRREADACSRLVSPHAVSIYDYDEAPDGIVYLAMELVRGESLQQVQKREGALAVLRVLEILDQVAEALGDAHAKGIVHRDMKPENIMVEPRPEGEFVKVLDFGIAKIVSGDKNAPALTAFGQTVGTLEFMSPEQLRGKALDGRSDIYALGIMAYEMLTGTLPFPDPKKQTDVIQFHLQMQPPPPSTLAPALEIPESVDELVMKMTAKAVDHRHRDVHELRDHIREVVDGLTSPPSGSRRVKYAVIAGGIAAALAALAALIGR